MTQMNNNIWKLYVIAVILCIAVIVISYFVTTHIQDYNSHEISIEDVADLEISKLTPRYRYTPDEEYFESFDIAIADDVERESHTVMGSDSYTEIDYSQHSKNVSDLDAKLYDIADRNFIVYYKSMRVSPIFPLALSNVETPGRADNTKAHSALYPSKFMPVELLDTADVTTVATNPSYLQPLSQEYSTRDRGALQMSPTYGTGNAYFNAKMSSTEKAKLSSAGVDLTGWAAGASDQPGDRFYAPDVCLRLSAAMTSAIEDMIKNNYMPSSELQLIAQMAMYHQSSGIWHSTSNKSVGNWSSSSAAYEYSKLITSTQAISAIQSIANSTDALYIDSKTAKQIYLQASKRPLSDFARKDIVCVYPIKVLYAYVKLCSLY